MAALWRADGPLTSAEVRDAFPEAHRPALTTILTVLSRLEDKERVIREPHASGATFAPAAAESADAAESMAHVLDGVADRQAALARFAGALAPEDVAALRRALDG